MAACHFLIRGEFLHLTGLYDKAIQDLLGLMPSVPKYQALESSANSSLTVPGLE